MKAIISGGRSYVFNDNDYKFLENLKVVLPITEVVSGRATGADECGYHWAIDNGIKTRSFPAKWDDVVAAGAVVKYRKDGAAYNALAGFWRNQEMADYADALVAFPGSSGTKDMKDRAMKKGLPVYEPLPGGCAWFYHRDTKTMWMPKLEWFDTKDAKFPIKCDGYTIHKA